MLLAVLSALPAATENQVQVGKGRVKLHYPTHTVLTPDELLH